MLMRIKFPGCWAWVYSNPEAAFFFGGGTPVILINAMNNKMPLILTSRGIFEIFRSNIEELT